MCIYRSVHTYMVLCFAAVVLCLFIFSETPVSAARELHAGSSSI